MSIFNKDFYPTPVAVLDIILVNFDLKNKIVLEPSSGKGDIIDYLKQHQVKDILCCELSQDLAQISSSKAKLIANDFLTVTSEQVSHIDMIIANPPFINFHLSDFSCSFLYCNFSSNIVFIIHFETSSGTKARWIITRRYSRLDALFGYK
jgi:hypothetical protein